MIDTLLNLLFRCSHKRMTRPMTPVQRHGEPGGETYVVCLECGKQFSYDLNEMRVGKVVPVSPTDGVLDHSDSYSKTKKIGYTAMASAVVLGVAFKWLKKGQAGRDDKNS